MNLLNPPPDTLACSHDGGWPGLDVENRTAGASITRRVGFHLVLRSLSLYFRNADAPKYIALGDAVGVTAGGKPFRVYSVDEISLSDDASAIRQGRVDGRAAHLRGLVRC
jgi:hypothetical protein